MKKPTITLVLGFAFGIVLMLMINIFQSPTSDLISSDSMSEMPKEKKPLYWVAPMDANYRRDEPGQSPMGMDLIPYYADDGGGNDEGPGTIRINPDVVNNLGVRTSKAIKKSLHFEINTVGYITNDEDNLVHIHPRIEGWIEKLYVKATGDKVKKGQPLYDIYSPALVNAQEELVLALNNNNKRLIKAAKERLESLQLPKSAIAKLMNSKKIQQNITFYSPQSGYVDKLEIRQGFFVKPGKTLMQIGNLDQVWVIAEVVESDISHIRIDLPVTMRTDALPTKSYRGVVDYIYPSLTAKNRTMKVRIRFDNPELLLKPNMFASVQIHHNENEQLLLVLKEAVIRSGKSNRVVLALGNGQFKAIIVETGRYDDDYIEILSGVNEGEMVVTSAQFLLDSESSKTSDFKRMNHQDLITEMDEPMKASVIGIIKSIMKDHGMLNIDREAIEEWGRPAANVDFITDNSVDISQLKNGDKVFFTFIIDGGNFVITEIDKLSTL